MILNQTQSLSLQQKLSPQQIQMIKLLELPAAMLEQRIKQEIAENIVLEEEQPAEESEQPQQISMDEYLREDDTPSYKSRINNFSKDDRPRNIQISGGRSFQESLVEQLGFRNLTEREMQLATFIVGSIDNDGYLRRDLESISDDIAFSLGIETSAGELERLLDIIQHLEPVGVGARDLRESLLLQLGQLPMTTKARRRAKKILTSYFEEFVKKHYERLISRLGVSEDDFRDAVRGSTFDAQAAGYASGNIVGHYEPVKFGIAGATQHPQVDYNGLLYSSVPYASAPSQAVNFVASHDGYTVIDKLRLSVKGDHADDELPPIDKLVHTILLTAQGVPFIRAGEEMMQDKQGEPNSFRSPDAVNRIDWAF